MTPGDLRHREDAELTAKRDEGGAAMLASLDHEPLAGDLLANDRAGSV